MKKILVLTLLLSGLYAVKAQVNFVWGNQFGTSEDDKARSLAIDLSGNIFVFGKTNGQIGTMLNGKSDGFIAKIDSAANVLWKIQLGSSEEDEITKGATDKMGNLYITGFTGISGENLLNKDILVAKINGDGKIDWQKKYGTPKNDVGWGIAVSDNGDIYVTGETEGRMADTAFGDKDCFILNLDNEGSQQNVVQFGTPAIDWGVGITIEMDSLIYVCGCTGGDLVKANAGNGDIFWGIFSKQHLN
jgi:hypothetical protein